MPISPYIAKLREHVGHARLLLPSVSIQLFDDHGRLLLVRQRDDDTWSTPGGAIEPDELPADAAVRELWEETGLHFRPERILGVYGGPDCIVRYSNGDEVQYVITAIGGTVIGGALQPDHDETLDARYWSREEAESLPLSDWLRATLDMVYARGEGQTFTPPTWHPEQDEKNAGVRERK